MSQSIVPVDSLTANHALTIYRRLGPDLRQLIAPPYGVAREVGWAFMPDNADHLLSSIRHFLRRIGIRKVLIAKNDFDFSYDSFEFYDYGPRVL
jgi:hypothetical protein